VDHANYTALEAGLPEIRRSPQDRGQIVLIVRRPAAKEREVLAEAVLDPSEGLVGDSWRARASAKIANGEVPDRRTQLTLMNARVAALVAGDQHRWPLAGDQLYVDFDLGTANVPPGTQLAVGTALIEISDQPHRGCGKFLSRFGIDAQRFVTSPVGRELNLRGVNAIVRSGGLVRSGEEIRKLGP
jgi:hypothetical protein